MSPTTSILHSTRRPTPPRLVPFAPCASPPVVRGLQRPSASLPCIIASASWTAWFYLLGTFNLEVLECYAESACPWIDQAVSAPNIRQWADFPLPGSPIFDQTPLILLLSGHPSLLECLSAPQLALHNVLYHSSVGLAPSRTILPFHVNMSHKIAGGGFGCFLGFLLQ